MRTTFKYCKCGRTLPSASDIADGLQSGLSGAQSDKRQAEYGANGAFARLEVVVSAAVAGLRGICWVCWDDAERRAREAA